MPVDTDYTQAKRLCRLIKMKGRETAVIKSVKVETDMVF